MAKKMCKCSVCGVSFDRNSIQAVKSGARRYAHQTCKPDGELVPMELPPAEDPDLQKLNSYITEKFGDKANWAMIKKQIKKYKEENKYSYSGILKSLIYFYDIKKNPIEKANGALGIVPFVYQDAYNYYFTLFQAQQRNINFKNNYEYKSKEVVIKTPKAKKIIKKLFNLEDEDEE